MVRDRDGRPQEDPLVVHCFCVCSGDALLGDLLGVSRCVESDSLAFLWFIPKMFLCVLFVSSLISDILLYLSMLMCVRCFASVVTTCQVIGWKDSSEDA